MDLLKRIQDLSDIYDDEGPSSTIPESRPMFNDGGMLVQPNADGSRPGYSGELKLSEVSKLRKEGNTADQIVKKLKTTKSRLESFITANKSKLPEVTKGTPIKPLDKEKQKIYDLLSQDKLPKVKGSDPAKRFRGKKWEELDNTARANFGQQIYPYYKDLLSKTKGMITEDNLVKLLSEKFGEDVKVNTIRGVSRTTKPGKTTSSYETRFSKEILKLLKPYNYTKKQKFYKIPTETDIRKLKNKFELRFSQTDTLRPNTVKNISILHNNFKNFFKTGNLPKIENVLEVLPKGTTPSQAGNATIRLAQIYAGKKFDLTFQGIDKKFANKVNSIKINNPTSKKMFEQISKLKFGDPYLDQLYRINLQMIDEKLGNKIGTFENLKDQATNLLKKNKIPIYDGRSKKPFGFNINEIVGVSGSASSKAAEFSQFIDVMEGNLNQNVLTGYQSQLSKARAKIEANPSLFKTESEKINAKALDLEKEYGVKLAKLRPAEDVTKVFSPTRLEQLKKQGLDIEAASKRAGYTFEMPKGAVTINEFLNPKHQQLIKNQFCPGNKVGGPPGSCDISEAMDNMIKQTNAVKQGAIKGTEATRIANKASKVARFGTGKGLAAVLGPIGLAGEAVFEVAMAAPGYARGESGKRLLGDSILGLIPGVGQSAEEEFAEYATKDGMSDLDQQKIKDVNRFLELNNSLPIALKNIGKGGRGDPLKGSKTFEKQYEEYEPLYNQFVGGPPSESASTAFAEQQRINDLINADKAIRAEQRNIAMDEDFMAAGGGIAKLAGDRSGPPPESGPNSQGLQGLFNRVKKV